MEKMSIRIVFGVFAVCFIIATLSWGQPISTCLVGNNAWNQPISDAVWTKAAECGLQIVRIGGEGYDGGLPGSTATWVSQIIAMGAQPIIQIPQNSSATAAANIVRQYPNVIFYNIGNEPDLVQFGAVPVSTAAAYIKADASAMKAVNPNIKIFVADCAWYDVSYYPQLFGAGAYDVAGKDANGRYYVDGLSFHKYPYDANGAIHGWANNTFVNLFRADMITCKAQVDAANARVGRTGANAIGWGIGEFNAVDGTDVHSFGNGQMHGAVLGLAMKYGGTYACSWSMYESGGNRGTTDFSFLDGGAQTPRASYRHMQLVAKNFSGIFLDATGTNGVGSTTDIFSYGCKDVTKSKLCALIMNRGAAQYTFSVRFDNTASAYGQTKINFNAAVTGEYQDVIAGNTTILLVFSSASKKYTYTSADFSAGRAPSVIDVLSPFYTGTLDPGQPAAGNLFTKSAFKVKQTGRELEIVFPTSRDYNIEIVGLNGSKVASSRGTGANARISNNALSTGQYFIRLKTSSGTLMKRVIVQ